jgi:CBS domain-containing protein
MLCRDLMKKNVARCAEELTVESCARMMRDNNVGFLPVVDGKGQVVGVVTDRDLALRVLADDLPTDTPVGEVMTREVRTCRADDDINAAELQMAAGRKSRVVVTDEGRCVGVISLSDVAQADSGTRAGDILRAVTRREAPVHVVLA